MSAFACEHSDSFTLFQLTDEQGAGEPYAGLVFDALDQEGGKHSGYLDTAGVGRISNPSGGPVSLMFAQLHDRSEVLYSHLMNRAHYPQAITELQVRAEQTRYLNQDGARPQGPPANLCAGHDYYQVEVRDLVRHVAHLPPEAECHQSGVARHPVRKPGQFGVVLAGHCCSVLEVRPLRALRPMLSVSSQFCALNLYQLALLATLGHCPFGLAAGKPREVSSYAEQSMRDWQVNPEHAKRYYPLYEDVAYSRRFEVMSFDPVPLSGNDPLLEAPRETPEAVHFLGDIRFGGQGSSAQVFITHHDEIILIAIRSASSWSAVSGDADEPQVPFEEGEGKVHSGFYQAARQACDFVNAYLDKFHAGQKILVCGHSVGGAVGLILAQMLRQRSATYDVQLYTYGSPRAADAAFVKGAESLVHHRMVNHDDPMPSVPGRWMSSRLSSYDADCVLAFDHVPQQFGVFIGGLNPLAGEQYQHHGSLLHFMPVDFGQGQLSHVMWEPVSDTVTQHAVSQVVLEQKNAAPEHDGLLKELVSGGQHFMLDSYIPSCWAALRRCQQAQEAGRSLVTEREVMCVDRAFENVAQQLREKYQQAMTRGDSQARGQAVGLLMREISKVYASRERLYCLRFKVPSLASVYGQFALRPEIITESLERWVLHGESRRTDQLALAPAQESIGGRVVDVMRMGQMRA